MDIEQVSDLSDGDEQPGDYALNTAGLIFTNRVSFWCCSPNKILSEAEFVLSCDHAVWTRASPNRLLSLLRR